MAIADDILIDYTNKRIYGETSFLAGSTFYTANALYTYVMDTFDEASQMDDQVPFSSETNILTYKVANGWYIEQALIKHLKGASVETADYSGAIYHSDLTTVNAFVSGDIGNTVLDDGVSVSGALLDYDNTNGDIWVRTTSVIANTSNVTISGGTGSGVANGDAGTGNELFSRVNSVGSVVSGYAYIEQNDARLAEWWGQGNTGDSTEHIDVLIKVKEEGTLIDSGDITVFNRPFGTTFSHVDVNLSAGGSNVAPLSTEADTNVTITSGNTPGAISGYVAAANGGGGVTSDIAAAFGYYEADIDDDGNEAYYCQVDCDSQSMATVYQALQWMCNKDRTSETLNSVEAEFYKSTSGSFTSLVKAPFGLYAGGTMVFAQGVYPINVGGSNYTTQDISGGSHTPPSTIAIATTGLVSGDRVSIFKADASGSPVKNMFTSSSNASGAGTFDIGLSIPKDTPAAGYIRAVDVSESTEQRYQYDSWATTVFTLNAATPLTQAYVSGTDTAYVGYIDEQATTTSISKTVQYVDDRTVSVRVRNSDYAGGNAIIPFTVASTIESTGLSVPASRNADNVINA